MVLEPGHRMPWRFGLARRAILPWKAPIKIISDVDDTLYGSALGYHLVWLEVTRCLFWSGIGSMGGCFDGRGRYTGQGPTMASINW